MYKAQTGLMQCYNCQQFSHVWASCKQSPCYMWCGGRHLHKELPEKGTTASIQTCCNCKLVDREEPYPSNYRGCRHAKEEMWQRKLLTAPKTTTGRVFSSSHATPGLSFMVVLCSNTQHQQQPQPPSVVQACLTTVGEMCNPLPWGTTNNKYQVSQFRLLMQTASL
jgi:hypothetical protein